MPIRGSDPRFSAGKEGIIYLSLQEFSRNFKHFEIAHTIKDYKEAYFDQENDPGNEVKYQVVTTEPITRASDLYITVETYFSGLMCS